MKRYIEIALLILVCVLCVRTFHVHAQSGNLVYIAPASGTTVTSCGTPTTGFPLCGVATGWYVWNGTAWAQIGTAPAGVTSLTVCNASGASCGTAQTGAVTLSVPKSVTITAGSATLQ